MSKSARGNPPSKLKDLGKDQTWKIASGSRYFHNSEHGVTVVLEIQYSRLFLVHIIYGKNGKKTKQQHFKREWFEKKLAETESNTIEIVIQKVVGQIRVRCLRKFLEEYPSQ